jgi:Chaperone of endosialidase
LVRMTGGVGINSDIANNVGDLVIGARAGGDADTDLQLRTRDDKRGSLYLKNSDGSWVLSASPTSLSYLTANGANGASLSTGGVWTNGSSRTFKENFSRVDAASMLRKVVDLPISTWTYKNSAEGTHIGPMAEDFKATFALGTDAQHIATVDADGVALAAIQGLNEKLETENAALRQRLQAIEDKLKR